VAGAADGARRISASVEMKFAAGIDIGGTKIAVGIADAQGRLAVQSQMPTSPEEGFPSALARMEAELRRLHEELGYPDLAGIGIGCAGPVDPRCGTIENPFTLPGWQGARIVSLLQETFGLPVILENDADAAAFGEYLFGMGQGHDPMLMLTFGTGVGGGIIAGGQIYRGFRGEHPELGHVPAGFEGPECYCGTNGCLESLASGTAIARAGRRAGYKNAREVFAAASRGDSPALCIVERALKATQTAVWTFLHTFVPARIVLGGGMMDEHFDLFAGAIREAISRPTQIMSRADLSVAPARLGNDAGLIGAAALILAQESP
jgi:glucokinase